MSRQLKPLDEPVIPSWMGLSSIDGKTLLPQLTSASQRRSVVATGRDSSSACSTKGSHLWDNQDQLSPGILDLAQPTDDDIASWLDSPQFASNHGEVDTIDEAELQQLLLGSLTSACSWHLGPSSTATATPEPSTDEPDPSASLDGQEGAVELALPAASRWNYLGPWQELLAPGQPTVHPCLANYAAPSCTGAASSVDMSCWRARLKGMGTLIPATQSQTQSASMETGSPSPEPEPCPKRACSQRTDNRRRRILSMTPIRVARVRHLARAAAGKRRDQQRQVDDRLDVKLEVLDTLYLELQAEQAHLAIMRLTLARLVVQHYHPV